MKNKQHYQKWLTIALVHSVMVIAYFLQIASRKHTMGLSLQNEPFLVCGVLGTCLLLDIIGGYNAWKKIKSFG